MQALLDPKIRYNANKVEFQRGSTFFELIEAINQILSEHEFGEVHVLNLPFHAGIWNEGGENVFNRRVRFGRGGLFRNATVIHCGNPGQRFMHPDSVNYIVEPKFDYFLGIGKPKAIVERRVEGADYDVHYFSTYVNKRLKTFRHWFGQTGEAHRYFENYDGRFYQTGNFFTIFQVYSRMGRRFDFSLGEQTMKFGFDVKYGFYCKELSAVIKNLMESTPRDERGQRKFLDLITSTAQSFFYAQCYAKEWSTLLQNGTIRFVTYSNLVTATTVRETLCRENELAILKYNRSLLNKPYKYSFYLLLLIILEVGCLFIEFNLFVLLALVITLLMFYYRSIRYFIVKNFLVDFTPVA